MKKKGTKKNNNREDSHMANKITKTVDNEVASKDLNGVMDTSQKKN